MWRFIFILFFVSVVYADIGLQPKIVGGNDAVLGQFPYFMSIRFGELLEHGCGSGIINKRYAITAAHCLSSDAKVAVAGAINLADPGVRYDIIERILHPEWNISINWNDIGLYKVERDIVFTNLIKPAPLNRFQLLSNVRTALAGHGAFTQHPPWNVHPRLQYLHSTTMSNTECIMRNMLIRMFVDPTYDPNIHDGHICAFASVGVGGCFGDSGSPLINRRTGEIMGVVVHGLSCARGAPDYYARVSHYRRWIDANVNG